MISAGSVISYLDMCQEEGVNLQRGMNFRLRSGLSVILMSLRSSAPYNDEVRENGKVLIYEGHDAPNVVGSPDPKTIDQPEYNPSGTLTENGKFYRAAKAHKEKGCEAELVKVYEKVKAGIWTYNGIFKLIDAEKRSVNNRQVFKFTLKLTDELPIAKIDQIDHNRMIPSKVKIAVWKRDKGKCVECGSIDNLHFDHIIPYSKGGSSLTSDNIQLLCARHNLAKNDKIE
jgi:hypothetical protein